MADIALHFSPLEALLHANLDRLMEFLKTDAFTFSVNGGEFACTVAEAILISPAVCDALQANPMNTNFSIASASIQPSDFGDFLAFARSRDCPRLPRERAAAFLSISTQLGNGPLALALLSSLGAPAASAKRKVIGEIAIDDCASQFYCYSADDLRLLDRQTLHRLLSSPSLTIESEDCLLRLLLDLDLGFNRSEFLGWIEISLLSKEGLSLFLDEISLDAVSEDIWQKIVSHLKGVSPAARLLRRSHPFPESLILQGIHFSFDEFEGKSSALLYRGSRDGFAASAFHGKCDEHSNTVTIIETTKGYIFGGFTPLAWDSSNQEKFDSSRKSFLFTVKNPHGNKARVFPMNNSRRAICASASYGPIFGSNSDIAVYDNGNINASNFTDLGGTYANDTGIPGDQVFTGERNFTVEDIEIFAMQP